MYHGTVWLSIPPSLVDLSAFGVYKGAVNGFGEQVERIAPGEAPGPFNPLQ